jgi:SpoVK/Ycf46/Vps4 family AAA+-type ATPase
MTKKRFERNSKKKFIFDENQIIKFEPFNLKQEPLSDSNIKNDNDSYFKNVNQEDLKPINNEINTLQDLINLGKSYNSEDTIKYVINLEMLNKCIQPLEELNNMIGLNNIKTSILNFVFYYLQNFDEDNKNAMKHTILEGHPGTGKTQVASILAKLYNGLGLTKNDKYFQYSRSDLIGKYLGHTSSKTQECFNKAKGGVIFIDEAYSLGNPEGRDSFSKECIDTINQNLTEMKDDIILIIAGYKEQLETSFFSYNPGLYRRFPFRFNTGIPSPNDLRLIFEKKITDNNWILNEKLDNEFFEEKRDYFKYNGGDIETLFYLTKIAHSKNVFGKCIKLRKKLTKNDVFDGFELFINNDEVKSRHNDIKKYIFNTMFV